MPEKQPSESFVKELLNMLPKPARTVLLWIIMFPLALAIGGMLLQVNVGALIQSAVNRSVSETRSDTVDIVNTMLNDRINSLDHRMAVMEETMRLQGDKTDKRLARLEGERISITPTPPRDNGGAIDLFRKF